MSYRQQRPTDDKERGRKRRRRSRWSPADPTPPSALQAIPKFLPAGLTIEQTEALLIRIRIDEISRKLTIGDLDIDYSGERSPSPEPIYDVNGKRVNTREQRARDKLNGERQALIDDAMKMNPHFKPPPDYTPMSTKKTMKIFIPIDRFPDYNFIGLIIGPRGNTQKRMERETGAKIAIRGKGSVKEGKARKDNRPEPGEDEPLHVLITADTEKQLQAAGKLINELLIPVEEGKNEHKRQQLRELAEINGTLRDRWWMTTPVERTWTPAQVKCQICGEVSHPTSDCSLKGKVPLPPGEQKRMESEYESFLAELGETPLSASEKAKDAYEEFKAAIGESASFKSAPPPPPPQPHPPPALASAEGNAAAAPPPWSNSFAAAPWATNTAAAVPPPWAQQQPWEQQQPLMQFPPSHQHPVPPASQYPPAPWQTQNP